MLSRQRPRQSTQQPPANDFSFIDIDLNDLIGEWARQAQLYRQEADKLTALDRTFDERKAAVEMAETGVKEAAASVLLSLHLNPEKAGLGPKPTVGVMDAYVDCSGEVRAARRAVWEAARARDDARAAAGYQRNCVRALEHKKEALQDAVKLKLNDLHAEPRAPKGAGELAREMNRDAAFGRKRIRGREEDGA